MPKCNLCKLNTYVVNIPYWPEIKAQVTRKNTIIFKFDEFGRIRPMFEFKCYKICYKCIDTIKALKLTYRPVEIEMCNQLQGRTSGKCNIKTVQKTKKAKRRFIKDRCVRRKK